MKKTNPDINADFREADLSLALKRHSLASGSTLRQALMALNSLSGASMTLFVTDPEEKLIGTITDGDLRRALLAGKDLETPVTRVMHKNFIAVRPHDDLCVKITEGRNRHIRLLPVLKDEKIVDIIDLEAVRTYLPIDAVLMAGGIGERLRPLTETTPKPLLPVGGKPIIDYNIEELEACGVEKIFVTVNYLGEQIEDHFNKRHGRSLVTCVREPRRLGTMGSISLVEGMTHENILLMNSDLLTNIDFEDLYLRHVGSEADLTIAAVPYSVSVPFAILQLENNLVKGLEEKPTFNYFANAGVYILKRGLLERVAKGEYLDTPDFIASLIADGGNVGYYPVQGTWIDIGSPDDYRHANELMSRSRNQKN